MENAAVRKYLLVSGAIFALVSLGHLFRMIYGLEFHFGSVTVPMWASWLGFLVPAVLSGWAFKLARK